MTNRMHHPPLVSIIIPCYNYGKYIEKCIYSALNQTHSNIEVVVVDNGSTDDSLKKIKKFSQDKRLKVIEIDENIPPWDNSKSAVAIAINKSQGEYISILYADDWYHLDKIQKQLNLFYESSSSVGVIYCHGYCYFEKSKKMLQWKHQSVRGYVFKDYLLNGDVVIPISPLVKRFCYDIIGLNNPWTGSEYDFLVMSQYVDFDYVDESLVVMRMHDKNDAKNIYSVYNRVRHYHQVALINENTRKRAGSLVDKRIATDCLSFGMTFVVNMDMCKGRKAIIDSIKFYPIYVFKPVVIFSIILTLLPIVISKYLLIMFGKSPGNRPEIY